ncbi:hypothetical protein [Acaryochloris sp. IP29b_bin.137]|uniref:hypothetical protein n=1 Tax=Acaryochloris sp. IP29b_bin.137 TaxID=2969217 RepID=UPI0026292CAA|nr:hypothetical protein [Acaryochloris sp. IP29b_bin.137]
MLKPIKVTLIGLLAATTTTLAIPQANAFTVASGTQSEALEQNDKTLDPHHKEPKIRKVRWRKKWVCFKRPIVFYRHGRKFVKFKRHCHWKRYPVGHHDHHR